MKLTMLHSTAHPGAVVVGFYHKSSDDLESPTALSAALRRGVAQHEEQRASDQKTFYHMPTEGILLHCHPGEALEPDRNQHV